MKTQKAATQKAATFKTPHEQKVEALTATPVVKNARKSKVDAAVDAAAKKAKAAKQSATPEQPAKKAKADADPRKGKLGSLLGHSVISVLRAMGRANWDYDSAKAAMTKAKIEAADHTIRRALKRGRDGEKKIAPLSKTELATLKA